jgi:hypothetical protein
MKPLITSVSPSVSDAITAAPGPMPNSGSVAQHETTTPALDSDVRKAMEVGWNEICADTGHYPLDFEWRRGKMYFWADLVARLLARYGWRKDGAK